MGLPLVDSIHELLHERIILLARRTRALQTLVAAGARMAATKQRLGENRGMAPERGGWISGIRMLWCKDTSGCAIPLSEHGLLLTLQSQVTSISRAWSGIIWDLTSLEKKLKPGTSRHPQNGAPLWVPTIPNKSAHNTPCSGTIPWFHRSCCEQRKSLGNSEIVMILVCLLKCICSISQKRAFCT